MISKVSKVGQLPLKFVSAPKITPLVHISSMFVKKGKVKRHENIKSRLADIKI
jgi:hypothetical protein